MAKPKTQAEEEENRRLFATRLREVVDKIGGPKAASEIMEVPLSTLNTYLAAQADPKVSAAMRIAAAARTTLAYLVGLTTIRDAAKLDFRRVEQNSDESSAQDVKLIPRWDIEVAAGAGRVSDAPTEVERIPFARSLLVSLGVDEDHAHLVTVRGDSMLETLADGDNVLIDTRNPKVRREGIYVVATDGLAMIKRVQIIASMGAVRLISDNPRYETVTARLDGGEFKLIGEAKLVMRAL